MKLSLAELFLGQSIFYNKVHHRTAMLRSRNIIIIIIVIVVIIYY